MAWAEPSLMPSMGRDNQGEIFKENQQRKTGERRTRVDMAPSVCQALDKASVKADSHSKQTLSSGGISNDKNDNRKQQTFTEHI